MRKRENPQKLVGRRQDPLNPNQPFLIWQPSLYGLDLN
jgi:hypothetical protein